MPEQNNWNLETDEILLWQGRPAPRCYTFRNWLQAGLGTLLFMASSFWLMVGVQLMRAEGYSIWLLIVPVLLVVASFALGPGQLIAARLRWEKIGYALTDRRLLVRNRIFGQQVASYLLRDFRYYRKKRYARNLLSLKLSFHNRAPVILECLEYPELLLKHLEQ